MQMFSRFLIVLFFSALCTVQFVAAFSDLHNANNVVYVNLNLLICVSQDKFAVSASDQC